MQNAKPQIKPDGICPLWMQLLLQPGLGNLETSQDPKTSLPLEGLLAQHWLLQVSQLWLGHAEC